MSWKTINRILGRAAIDPEFWQALQRNPLQTLKEEDYELSQEELGTFSEFMHLPFSAFCQRLLEKLAPEEWY
ncbi:MAG TPA: Os1348 family NHLP clan protein [Ktedonobacteraceae bacterium]|nr:Os1348 family NHLP clan protein [Ktedonobacteraceae bacterium]